MENLAVLCLRRQAVDCVPLARIVRVAFRSQHHRQSSTPVPLSLDQIELSFNGVFDQDRQIRLEAQQDGLGFRVAHAAVEFQHLGNRPPR